MELLVGTYASSLSEHAETPEGICTVSFDPETGSFGAARVLAKAHNASYILMDPTAPVLFAVRETTKGDAPALHSYSFGADGSIAPLSSVPIAGELPCHLAFDADNMRLASAQYLTGDVALCRVIDGALRPPVGIPNLLPLGPKPQRQEAPHGHCVAFSDQGTILHVVDLGTDSVTSHRLNANDAVIDTAVTHLPLGCGPRHIALNAAATRGFVMCELDETIIVLTRDGIGWNVESVHAGFPPPEDGLGAGAAIRLSADEKHLYLSGRRQNAIACFSVDGEVQRIAEFSTGGATPRDFIQTSDGKWIIVAHQDSGTLTSIRCDPEQGVFDLSDHRCEFHKPVSVLECP